MARPDPEVLSRAAEALMAGNVSGAILARKSNGTELFDEEGEARILELILTRTPKALADCPPQYLPPLRVAAALMELFGEGISFIRKLISVEDDYSYRYEPDIVCLMLHSHASHLLGLSEKADAGIAKVQMTSSRLPDVCAACLKEEGEIYPLEAAPELPHSGCTCPYGCACILVALG